MTDENYPTLKTVRVKAYLLFLQWADEREQEAKKLLSEKDQEREHLTACDIVASESK